MACTVSKHKSHFTAEASTLLLPHPFRWWHTPDGSSSLPSFSFSPHLADARQPTLVFSPVFLFLSFYSVSLYAILWFSQKHRENPCRDRQSSASDRQARRPWSLAADEAHPSCWLTDQWKSWRQANLARLACSTTAYRQLRTHRSTAQSANYPPPTCLHLFCSCFAFSPSSPHSVTTFHLIAESPYLPSLLII